MPGEILTLQVGQCGNQVGNQYWDRLCREHGISTADGTRQPLQREPPLLDTPEIFYSTSANGTRYTPRAILLDLEPGVIGRTPLNGLFNPRNVYVLHEGSSSGNSWLMGFQHASEHAEHLLEMVDRELDACDNLDAFQLVHLVAGGTGSGMGSFLLQQLDDRYGLKKLLLTHLVFEGGSSSVTVNPYNTMLSLKRLVEHSDACVVYDNLLLNSIASESFTRLHEVLLHNMNEVVVLAMAGITNTIRFPSYTHTLLTSVLLALVPTPDLKFLAAACTPLSPELVPGVREMRSMLQYDAILQLLERRQLMVSNSASASTSYLALLEVLMTPQDPLLHVDPSDSTHKALTRAHQRVRFVPWCSSGVQVVPGTRLPYLPAPQPPTLVAGFMVANSTAVVPLLKQITAQFDQLFLRRAFLGNFVQCDLFNHTMDAAVDELGDCREVVKTLIDEYTRCEDITYLEE